MFVLINLSGFFFIIYNFVKAATIILKIISQRLHVQLQFNRHFQSVTRHFTMMLASVFTSNLYMFCDKYISCNCIRTRALTASIFIWNWIYRTYGCGFEPNRSSETPPDRPTATMVTYSATENEADLFSFVCLGPYCTNSCLPLMCSIDIFTYFSPLLLFRNCLHCVSAAGVEIQMMN